MMPKKKSTPTVDHEKLVEVARAGLAGIAADGDIGPFQPASENDGVWTIQAESTQPGYPGWLWTVTLTEADGGAFSVAEVNLLPGPGALLSPDWVPWSDRLDEYRRQEAERVATELVDIDDDDDDVADDDMDDVLDGIDIDQLDLDLELDPSPLEVPDEPNDVFDHVEFDDED